MNEPGQNTVAASGQGLAELGASGWGADWYGAVGVLGGWRGTAEPWGNDFRGSVAHVPARRVRSTKPKREAAMRWLRDHDLLLVIYGTPALAAVLQWVGVFHV
jgi:hypothetical protein